MNLIINRYLLILVNLFLIVGCSSPVVNLEGLWISEDENDVVLFRNDTVYSMTTFPMKYRIEKKTLISGVNFLSNSTNRIPFKIKEDVLSMSIDEGRAVEYRKSHFDNSFDHKINKFGIKLDLQKGFSEAIISSKLHYQFIYVGLSKDSSITIIHEGKELNLGELSGAFSKKYYVENPRINCAIAVDKNVLFSDYLLVYRSIVEQDSTFVRMRHAVVNKPRFQFAHNPWLKASYEQLSRINFVSDFPNLDDEKFDYIILGVDKAGGLLLNNNPVENENIYERIFQLYSQNSERKVFIINGTDNLTYGNYILFASMKNSIVFDKRNQYSIKKYGKDWPELKRYDLAISGSKDLRDLLTKNVNLLFPSLLLVQNSLE